MELLRRLFGLGDATAAPGPARRPVVAEGAVTVGSDGMTSFFSHLPPAEIGGGNVALLTWLTEADRRRIARLPSEAYCGALIRFGGGRPDTFIANGHFFEFIQFAIAEIGPGVEGLQRTAQAAQRQGGRNVYVYDARIDAGLMANPAEMPPDEEALGRGRPVGRGRADASAVGVL